MAGPPGLGPSQPPSASSRRLSLHIHPLRHHLQSQHRRHRGTSGPHAPGRATGELRCLFGSNPKRSRSIALAATGSSQASHRGRPRRKRWAIGLHLSVSHVSENLSSHVKTSKGIIKKKKKGLWDSFPILHGPSPGHHRPSPRKVRRPFQQLLPTAHLPPPLPRPCNWSLKL